MQEKTEDTAWSLTAFKERLRDLESRHLLSARVLEYFVPFFLFVFFVTRIFARLDLYYTAPDSARYMLSAMVQAQAAIVAIVVTLTLVAVQLTASAYSPRVTRIFGENPDMWLLLLFYGASISYGFLVLKQIRTWPLSQLTLFGFSLEHHLVCAYSIGGFTFLMLFPYMRNTITLLNPSTILNRLTVKIAKGTLFESNDDPIQPIIDIVHGSIMRYDLATTRFGLKTLTDQIVGLIDTELAADDDHEAAVTVLRDRFCIPIAFAGKLAVSRDDEKSTLEVIENLQKFGESVVMKVTDEFAGLEWAAVESAYALKVVGRAAIERGLERPAMQTVYALRVIGRAVAKKELPDAVVVVTHVLRDLGLAAIKKKLPDAAEQAAFSLGVVGRAAAGNKLPNEARQATYSLIYLGVATFKSGLQKAATVAAKSLAELALVNKEIVDNVFHEFKSKLEDKEDHDAYHDFMALFNKELQELRKEKEKKNSEE